MLTFHVRELYRTQQPQLVAPSPAPTHQMPTTIGQALEPSKSPARLELEPIRASESAMGGLQAAKIGQGTSLACICESLASQMDDLHRRFDMMVSMLHNGFASDAEARLGNVETKMRVPAQPQPELQPLQQPQPVRRSESIAQPVSQQAQPLPPYSLERAIPASSWTEETEKRSETLSEDETLQRSILAMPGASVDYDVPMIR